MYQYVSKLFKLIVEHN